MTSMMNTGIKAVILAGGLGSRLAEETVARPKPMVEIGGLPILWHIMKIYSAHGINDFILCLGYKGYLIKEYFSNYLLHMSDVTFDFRKNTMTTHAVNADPWRVTLVETGENSMTGGRLKRVMPYLAKEELFCMTYGDGVGDINITALIDFHRRSKRLATLTGTQTPGRFGALFVEDDRVIDFKEKPTGEGAWINGGFFVLSPKVGDYIADDSTVWEQEPLTVLAREGELGIFRHDGFWQPMDTIRDRIYLEKCWASGSPPWRKWTA